MIIELFLGLMLSVIHIFGEDVVDKFRKHSQMKILSFGAGISITYLFLQYLPELYSNVILTNKLIFIYVLLGFILLHLREKYIYQHVEKRRLLFELKEAHSLAFFLYHFALGLIIVKLIQTNIMEGILLFIPILFHTTISNVSLGELHHHIKEHWGIRILLSLAPFAGVIFGIMVEIPDLVYLMLLGFVGGALLYVIVRDVLPSERKGYVEYFLSGTIVYALLIILTWML